MCYKSERRKKGKIKDLKKMAKLGLASYFPFSHLTLPT